MATDLMSAVADFQRCVETRDRVAAEELLDPDFALVLVAPERAIMPRARWLEVLEDYVIHSYELEDQIVDVDGSEAAVVARIRISATVLSEDRSGLFVASDFWRQRDGSWRVWRRHSTPLSAGRMPGA